MAKKQMAIAIIVAVFIVLSAMNVKAVPVESGGLRYEVSSESGTASVESFLGTEDEIVVKKSIKLGSESYPVTQIADEAFAITSVTKVKLPETIESIGSKAFYRCYYLAEINIPEGLKKVGQNAFGDCRINPTFPEGCEVPENVFALEESETENGNETDGTGEGEGTKSEDEKSDDDKVADPGTNPGNSGDNNGGETPAEQPATNEQSNKNAQQVEKLETAGTTAEKKGDQASPAPASSTTETAQQTTETTTTATEKAAVVDTFALNGSKYELFSDGTAVLKKVSRNKKNLRVPNSVSYQGKKYRVVRISNKAAKGCEKLVKVTLKGNLREIGNKAFYGCKKLKKVNVKNVTKIGDKAFYGCKKLKGVTSNGNVTTIGKKAFGKCSKKLNVTGLLQ